ncbi:tyrosine-type recombinase/integrase [Rhizobium herbae]
MAKFKLTDKNVRALTTPGRHSDGANLYLRIRETGSKSFCVVTKYQGRPIEITIGPYGDRSGQFSLASARMRSNEIMTTVRGGQDPRLVSNQDSSEQPVQKAVPPFGEFAFSLIDQIEGGFQNPKHRLQWRATLETYCAEFWHKAVDEISTDDVIRCLVPIWTTKAETASRVRGRVQRILDAAKAKNLRSGENPAAWKGHLALLLPPPRKLQRGHHAAMPYATLPEFWQQLSKLESYSSAALKFTILTAARSNETRGAKWNELDLENAVWTVPAERMKAGREHRVPLSPAAIEIVQQMQAMSISDFVFASGRLNRPLSDMALLMCLKGLCQGVTVHGFRSSFRDWVGEETDFARETAEAALAHNVGDSTERAYRRSDALQKRRSLMNAWSAFVTTPGDLLAA